MDDLNSLEVLVVQKDLQDKGYRDYKLRSGNDCIWATVRSGAIWLDFYYIFRNGKLADIQVD